MAVFDIGLIWWWQCDLVGGHGLLFLRLFVGEEKKYDENMIDTNNNCSCHILLLMIEAQKNRKGKSLQICTKQ